MHITSNDSRNENHGQYQHMY